LVNSSTNQSSPVVPVQAIECHHGDLRLADPGRLELGAKRHDQQHRKAADMLDGDVEHITRGRVDPMHVLENDDHRLVMRQAFELPDQRLLRSFLLALRADVRQRVALRSRQRQQIDEECHILDR
jgi:hypothetical protein